MRLDPRAFGWAAGTVAVTLFLICSLAVALAPETTAAVGGFLLHVDLQGFTRSLTWTNFVGGVLGWGIFATVVSSLLAVLYNRLGGAGG